MYPAIHRIGAQDNKNLKLAEKERPVQRNISIKNKYRQTCLFIK